MANTARNTRSSPAMTRAYSSSHPTIAATVVTVSCGYTLARKTSYSSPLRSISSATGSGARTIS